MRLRAGVWALAVCLAWPLSASGQEAVPTSFGGRPGLWFPLEDARAAVSALAEVSGARQRLHLLEDQLVLADAELVDLRAALALAVQAEEGLRVLVASARTELEAADRRGRQAAAERDVWAGVATGAGAAAAVLAVILGAVLR